MTRYPTLDESIEDLILPLDSDILTILDIDNDLDIDLPDYPTLYLELMESPIE